MLNCSSQPSLAERVRNEYVYNGYILLGNVEDIIPTSNELFERELATAINDDKSPGIIDEKENKRLETFAEDFQENSLLWDLRSKSLWMARARYLHEKIPDWCVLGSCRDYGAGIKKEIIS